MNQPSPAQTTSPDQVWFDELQKPDSYQSPTKPCDVVMKGGVTSGVTYPLALCELAREYRFKRIGGTSAGAIAAAILAATELGRQKGNPGAFAELAKLPEELKKTENGKTLLARLFQPQPQTKALFDFGMAILGATQVWQKILVTLTCFWWQGLLGLIPGLALIYVETRAPTPYQYLMIGFGILIALLGAVIAIAVAVWCLILRLPKNNYGLCKGLETHKLEQQELNPKKPKSPKAKEQQVALITWLSKKLDALAMTEGKPLTFKDLSEEKIDLRLITTSLTHGRPYEFPTSTQYLYFRKSDLKDYLPEYVLDWMVENPRPNSKTVENKFFREKEILALPLDENLPVILAVRMSLSFPVLFSAVPLWGWKLNKKPEERKPEQMWFTDGGITSNFPIHLFDQAIPDHPTFAFNLTGAIAKPIDAPDDTKLSAEAQHANVNNEDYWLNKDIKTNPGKPPKLDEGSAENWFALNPNKGIYSVIGYLGSILEVSRNWQDNTLLRAAGHRDRVAHIHLASTEGGLNLNMKSALIEQLAMRGWWAGDKLRRKFAAQPKDQMTAWQHHTQIRYRRSMYALYQALEPFRSRAKTLGTQMKDVKRKSGWSGASKKWVNNSLKDLITIAQNWETAFKASVTGVAPSAEEVISEDGLEPV